jgi:hypothetical protein
MGGLCLPGCMDPWRVVFAVLAWIVGACVIASVVREPLGPLSTLGIQILIAASLFFGLCLTLGWWVSSG